MKKEDKKTVEKFLTDVNKTKDAEELFSEENAEKAKSIIRLLIGDDSMFRDKKEA